jgi:hypothetical protein
MLLSALLTLSSAAVPDDVVQRVASRKVFFGHQSVGANILEGVAELGQGQLSLAEGRDQALFTRPALVHTLIGKNEAPREKIADFEQALEAVGGAPDIALYKFCYIDFTASTDAEALFAEYLASHQRLKAKYPALTLVHVTVPLTTVQSGLKAWLKQKVQKQAPWGWRENEVRHRFNELMRTRLAGQPLFDLAALESTRADGTAATAELDGKRVPALVPEFSDDGQHLNGLGRRRVAEALLTFLAGLP